MSPEQYLQSPLQLQHALHMLLDSELFQWHSERMCELMVDDARKVCTPHDHCVPELSVSTDNGSPSLVHSLQHPLHAWM